MLTVSLPSEDGAYNMKNYCWDLSYPAADDAFADVKARHPSCTMDELPALCGNEVTNSKYSTGDIHNNGAE
jgi:hypothetical protein